MFGELYSVAPNVPSAFLNMLETGFSVIIGHDDEALSCFLQYLDIN